MIIDENIKIIKLIDTYGELLTDRQLTIAKSYYFDNLTLSEIAECHNISRQAVRDAISQSVRILNDYEDKLHFIEKCNKVKSNLNEIKSLYSFDDLTDKINKCLDIVE